MPRAAPLYQKAVEEAVTAYLGAMETPVHRYRAKQTVETVIRAYLALAADASDRRISPTTQRMMDLEIGEAMIVERLAPQDVRRRMKTARKLTNDDTRRFISSVLPDGKLRVTRVEPDYKPVRPVNPKSREMASLLPGQEIVSTAITSTRGKGQIGTNTKVAARKLMGLPHADWTVKAGPRGSILLKRIR